jgi:hypothetical protein
MDLLKKEFKCLKSLWQASKQQTTDRDELEMAITRLRLKIQGEIVQEDQQNYILDPQDIAPMKLKLNSDKTLADMALKQVHILNSISILLYLKL